MQLAQNRNFHQLTAHDPTLVTTIGARNVANLVAAIQFAEFYNAFHTQDGDGHDKHEALWIVGASGYVPLADELVIAMQQRRGRNVNEQLSPFKLKVQRLDPRDLHADKCVLLF